MARALRMQQTQLVKYGLKEHMKEYKFVTL